MKNYRWITAFNATMVVLVAANVVLAENWPCWRGPRGDGSSHEVGLPVEWDASTGKNIVWKTELPGKGHSSPIVWQDRAFVTTCLAGEQQRLLMCLDTATGNELWRREVLRAPLETLHKLNSFASGTPATDGELIFVAFLKVDGETFVTAPNVGGQARDITPGTIVLSAVDFNGEIRWQVEVGDFVSAHGFCSCPVLYGDLVILNGDHDGSSYLVAFNKSTGKEVWRTARQHGVRSYVTPIIRTIEGREQLVLAGSKHVAGFDVHDGKLLWNVEGPTEQFVASMVFDGERVILAAGFPTHHVMAIRPTGSGNVTDTHVAWHVDKYVRCYVPSPILIGERLFVADDRGTASCFDSANGERVWQDRLAGAFNASLVANAHLVYFLARDGVTKVIEPEKGFSVLAENSLHEQCDASPAISNGCFYVRGEHHLFCIGNSKAQAANSQTSH